MNTIENAGKVAKHSWSVRLMALAVLLESFALASPLLLPEIEKIVEPETLSYYSVGLIVTGIIARFIKQTKVSG